ncbi:tellurite resistance/C4-dicarboxylate transporter family protein [Virgibacillus halodenitrificans]|uniref:C4-dicarboxylate ABC transporter n=1 Tax=Virgibacillus halodenitrificans TaxID=1482 RepID=A0AAC9J1P3_VIRHA|nr:tellurite resistance/C4-dicarboxylate transporter family protein [Virgibacillus halodenitrificans]APC49290.1 C4-dicarboxylate ABC transporter [Virgibacillus halodenitrificans]MCG1026679.1 tellurite resistance/C4-dicarboxylate transporter family protein [Virgibacillus halodenitrificans]
MRGGCVVISFITKKAKYLFPGYFALVMATGALSIGSYMLGYSLFSTILLVINTVAYCVLWVLTIIRILFYFQNIIHDVTHHMKGPGFFTLVAGTSVYGSQLIIVGHSHLMSQALWVFAIILWVIIMYTFFTAVTIRKEKPTIEEGINGAWLIASVATQSVSILGTLLSPYMNGQAREAVLFFTLAMYFLGCMLYLNIITLIFYRFTFVKFKFEALTPPYWINMGAVAITTLAGSTLILHAELWQLLNQITPFLKGFTLFFWITGTWWIPLLFILMIWRHVINQHPISYEPQYWGMAFPLAMYMTSTYQFSKAVEVEFLMFVPHVMFYIAIAAWLFGFIGLFRRLWMEWKGEIYL